jgi:hypothetical protein
MTKYFEPTLESVCHYRYPFLLDYAFDLRDGGKFRPRTLQALANEYLIRHARHAATKNGASIETAFESLANEIRACWHTGQEIHGYISDGHANKLMSRGRVRLESSVDGMSCLDLKRFGACLGIGLFDRSSNRHELGTKLFNGMVQSENGTEKVDGLYPFVQAWLVTMSSCEYQRVDIAAELDSVERYAPDVAWTENADGAIAKLLEDDYVARNDWHSGICGGVEVGQYHGIPVRMQLLFGGDKATSTIWRKGAVTRDGTKLSFQGQSDPLYIRYVVGIADDGDAHGMTDLGIDYLKEQSCLKGLAAMLLNAFSVKGWAERIANRPELVAWKLKEPQAEAAA